MIKQFLNVFIRDWLLTIRNGLLWFVLIFLLLLIIMVRFVIPEQIELTEEQYVADLTEQKQFLGFMQQKGMSESEIIADEETLDEMMSKNKNAFGIVIRDRNERTEITIKSHGEIAERNINLIKASFNSMIRMMEGRTNYSLIKFRVLRENIPIIPLNKSFIPAFLIFEIIILGFFFVAVQVFDEKMEGSINTYRMSPSGTINYIMSKNLVFLILGIIYGFSFILFTIGTGANYIYLLILLILGLSFMTILGLAIAVFFKNLSEWFATGMFIMIIVMLPTFSYMYPVFAPPYITYIPSYIMMFTAREIVFPSGNESMIHMNLFILFIETIVIYFIAHILVNKKIMKAG